MTEKYWYLVYSKEKKKMRTGVVAAHNLEEAEENVKELHRGYEILTVVVVPGTREEK